MKPEKRQLVHALLDDQRDARREATLRAGGRILRGRRQRRMAFRSIVAVTFLALAAFSLQRMLLRQPTVVTVAQPPLESPPAQSLTDAQLLALFPDTPVGLVTLEDGRKRLIFPRPGDEARFVKRL